MNRWLALSSVAAMFLLSACPPGASRPMVWEGPVTRQDSVGLAQRILWGHVIRLDSLGRTSGSLPPALPPVLGGPEASGTDPWGRRVRYTPQGLGFELRSAGPDGVLENEDDVVAVGRVGRNLPCETRDQYGTRRYEHIVTACSTAPPVVLPLCPGLLRLEPAEQPGATARDSLLMTGRRLVRFARIVDGVGRERGGLPPALTAVPGQPRLPEWGLPDAWARSVRYTPQGQRFELRSAGPDARFHTSDDITLAGELGQTIPCQFQMGTETIRCDAPAPPCP
jgi:hypothetical protein